MVPSLRQAPLFAVESPRLSSGLFVLLQRTSFSLLVLLYGEQNLRVVAPPGNSPGSNGKLPVLIYSYYAEAIAQPTCSIFVSRLAPSPQLVQFLRSCLGFCLCQRRHVPCRGFPLAKNSQFFSRPLERRCGRVLRSQSRSII